MKKSNISNENSLKNIAKIDCKNAQIKSSWHKSRNENILISSKIV